MKKFLLSLAILVAVSISARAQFDLGIKGGVNFSNIAADNFGAFGSRMDAILLV